MTRVTQAEFARMAGVNRSTVHRWLQNGRIEADANGLIDPDAAARMRDATESPMPHHQARKSQFDEQRQVASGQPPAEPSPACGRVQGEGQSSLPPKHPEHGATVARPATEVINKEDVRHRRDVAVMLEREWTAKQREVDARKSAGELYEKERVRNAWRNAFILMRTIAESVPDRNAAELAAMRETAAVRTAMAGYMADMLNEVSSAFDRALDGL